MEMADQRAENNVVSGQPQNIVLQTSIPQRNLRQKKFAVACAVLASMTCIILDIGVMSGASLFIKENLKISDVQVEVLNGTLNIYSLISSALAASIYIAEISPASFCGFLASFPEVCFVTTCLLTLVYNWVRIQFCLSQAPNPLELEDHARHRRNSISFPSPWRFNHA
ncbi:hypothetical protein DVH24_042321 [Malus domestica]|uniref:Major facilitator superfamily (MFS) profile domain-containing protein n=1 Tax=Malus domestica TaxID=3750 RepID=A0A498IYF9_MALDO|nr:hypothetical protein DVH24_042321 [Malus domestica]